VSRVLVTGATGYIGSAVARRLAQSGHPVTATARQPDAALAKILPQCELLPLDVLKGSFDSLPKGVEVVVHTATANDIISRDFAAGLELSVTGTQRLLKWCRSAGVRRFLFFSTFQVYGTELQGTIDESTPPAPLNDYGLNHLLGEELCAMHARTSGFEVALVRPANVCGCPQSHTVRRETLVPMCFVREVLASGRITLRSSGLQKRDFVTVRQVADACRWLCDTPFPAKRRVVNVASGTTWTVLDLAQWTADAICRMRKTEVPIVVESSEPAASNEFRASSCVPASDAPRTTRDEIITEIEKTLEFFEARS
jgi:nucleoside-diphosphate-sugar epimerase